MPAELLSFEAFAAYLAAELDLTDAVAVRETDLADDWGLDSLDLFRALALTEELVCADSAVAIEDSEVLEPQVATAGDLYELYLGLATGAGIS